MGGKFSKNRKSIRLKDFDYSQDGFYFVTICTKNREYYFGSIDSGEMELNEIGQITQNCWKEIPQHFDNVILDEFIIMPNHIHGIIYINNDEKMDADIAENPSNIPVNAKGLVGDISGNRQNNNEGNRFNNNAGNRQNNSAGNRQNNSAGNRQNNNAGNRQNNNAGNRQNNNAGNRQNNNAGNRQNYDVGNRHACSLPNNDKRKYEKLPIIIGSFKSSVTRFINKTQTEIYFAWQKSYYDHIIRDENALNSIRQYILNNPLKWELDRENKINTGNKYIEMLEY